MDNQPAPQTPNNQPQPQYIGSTNIVDRSSIAPPAVGAVPPPVPSNPPNQYDSNDQYREASSAFAEAKVLLCGLASSTSYILITYLVKNLWATAIISAALAIAAIFFAMVDYRQSGKVTPLTIVGLSAATITLVYIANVVVAHLVVRSVLGTYGY